MAETSLQRVQDQIDPDMAKALARSAEIVAEKGLGARPAQPDPIEARARMAAERAWWNEDLPEMTEVRDAVTEGPHGPVPVRVLYPESGRPMPALIYAHGGGWVVGSLETHHRAMRLLALASGCAVVAVDYRLAPEHKYPVALEEILAVAKFIAEKGDDWGLDGKRILLGGDSAGANLAMAAALRLRDEGNIKVRGQILFYGAYGMEFDTESYLQLGDGSLGLSRDGMKWYWRQYLDGEGDFSDPYAIPMLAELEGLPPTHLFAAGLDPLRDDSVRMAALLRKAGVPGDFKIYDGVMHAFINLSRMVPKAHTLIDDAAAALREMSAG